MTVTRYLFQSSDPYSLQKLNEAVQGLANNDSNLLSVVNDLETYLQTTPFPESGIPRSPDQMKTWIDMVYDAASTQERIYSVVSPEVPRYLGEMFHLFDIEPFKSLKEGNGIVNEWAPVLRVFSMLKGMIYLVEDGPDYNSDPVFIKDGQYFVTSITNEIGHHLLCSEDGTVLIVDKKPVYKELTSEFITLIEFFLKRLESQKLRTLYRISCFEAGFDSTYSNVSFYDFVNAAFTDNDGYQTRRLPCGFTQKGELLFLRTEAGKYRGSSLSPFVPGLTPTSGVEDRIVIDESLLMTPMGVIRIPKCIVKWGDLITNRESDPDLGDPVVFVGLKIKLSLQKRDSNCTLGTAVPAIVSGSGFNGGIELLEKSDVLEIENYPHNSPKRTHGILGEYFNNKDLTDKVLERIDDQISFDWRLTSPDPLIDIETFSVRWTGKINPKTTERYTFHTVCDDGVRLWVDNILLIDHWADTPAEYVGSIDLVAGKQYDIKMEFYENGGYAQANLFWSTPTIAKEIIGKEYLTYHTAKDNLFTVGKWGHENGLLIGYIQKTISDSLPQYTQIQVEVTAKEFFGKTLLSNLLSENSVTNDEVSYLNKNAQAIDPPPNRLVGITPRKILKTIAPQYSDLELDLDQNILVKLTKTSNLSEWEVVVPLFLHLLKNERPFEIANLNGCTTRFNDGWAIRTISSVQPSLGTITFDDGNGVPEGFPEDFIGSSMSVYTAEGIINTTIVDRIGDKLARLPSGVVEKIAEGDVVTFDRRKPSASLDGAYLREASKTNLVDIRPISYRMVDTVVSSSDVGILSPSPTPVEPWYSLQRVKNSDLIKKSVEDYSSTQKVIESKLRWNYPQKAFFKASERRDLVQVGEMNSSELKTFLLRWVAEYDKNSPHDWIAGEGVIIHWPEKSAVTKVGLSRYLPPAVPGQEDGITIETVEGYGSVPVFTRSLRSGEHYRYPLRFIEQLAFASEKSFQIPGHTKLAGSFNLSPKSTWITDPIITVQLYQTQNVKGSKQKVLLGSVDFDWQRPTSFTNAKGVFRIDGDARYEPTSQFLSINYNQIIDFTNDEPGTLVVSFSYHDLSEIHPVFKFEYGQLGINPSHLFDAQPLALKNGQFVNIPDTTMKLEGITLNNGWAHLRFDRNDSFTILSNRGYIKTRWVLTGIPVISIDSVSRDSVSGQITDLSYTSTIVKKDMTVSTLLKEEKRNKQNYFPCNLKYGWTDLSQSNIQTEEIPFDQSPRFGFYEVISSLSEDKALTVKSAIMAFKASDVDYRFLTPFTSSAGMTEIKSVAVLVNMKTLETKAFVGVYRDAVLGTIPTVIDDEITLSNFTDQKTVYIRDSEITADWTLSFAGVLVAIRDENMATTPGGDSKLSLVGYWYDGHTLVERGSLFNRISSDVIGFDTGLVFKNIDFYRVGDVPGYLYRDNTLLQSNRSR